MVVKDHYIVHIILLFVPLEPQPMGVMVLNLVDFNERPINELSTTLELKNMHNKSNPLLNSMPSNKLSLWFH
jgi:hypothetical protein